MYIYIICVYIDVNILSKMVLIDWWFVHPPSFQRGTKLPTFNGQAVRPRCTFDSDNGTLPIFLQESVTVKRKESHRSAKFLTWCEIFLNVRWHQVAQRTPLTPCRCHDSVSSSPASGSSSSSSSSQLPLRRRKGRVAKLVKAVYVSICKYVCVCHCICLHTQPQVCFPQQTASSSSSKFTGA